MWISSPYSIPPPSYFDFSYAAINLQKPRTILVTIRLEEAEACFKHDGHPENIDFYDNEFSTKFVVRSADSHHARCVIDLPVRRFLLTISDRLGSLEIGYHGDSICISDGESIWEPERFAEVADWAETLAGLLNGD